ncbi:MAG: hypothetical protein K2R98_17755 [Gemmataceae bacterium]|nr:hypothetical protein [Gemmataceae bacterium]
MSPWIKLAIPIGLGLVAAAINFYVMTDKPAPRAFAVAREDIRSGAPFKESSIGVMMVPGEVAGSFPRTAVPYAHRETIYGRPATRDLKRGDMILWQDSSQPGWELSAGAGEEALPISLDGLSTVPRLIRVGDQVGFLIAQTGARTGKEPLVKTGDPEVDYIGPFRVLSVGERISRDGDKKSDRAGDDRIITVAMKLGPNNKIDETTRKYLVARVGERSGTLRIVGLVLHSSHKAATPEAPGG